ncbi:DUF892 family protein [Luteolibacter ambystomatis]|uniref:DUF892 family protein n=1 Tax=Luteolibacter ambystomatis TaxID=2824561 RepID=A0A975PH38_9BACT|nr:DUF892 family protein [Luteolibacter ambystomatis]QUE53215.1 DUF892 family protein [Luteolibacter ambystomatis]
MHLIRPSDLLADQIRDLFSAETQIVASLPELSASAGDAALKGLLTEQEGLSRGGTGQLESLCRSHGVDPAADPCKAMAGLISGGADHLKQAEPGETRDLLLIAHCSRVFSYLIAAYGISAALARRFGSEEEAAMLEMLLDERNEAIRRLMDLARCKLAEHESEGSADGAG